MFGAPCLHTPMQAPHGSGRQSRAVLPDGQFIGIVQDNVVCVSKFVPFRHKNISLSE